MTSRTSLVAAVQPSSRPVLSPGSRGKAGEVLELRCSVKFQEHRTFMAEIPLKGFCLNKYDTCEELAELLRYILISAHLDGPMNEGPSEADGLGDTDDSYAAWQVGSSREKMCFSVRLSWTMLNDSCSMDFSHRRDCGNKFLATSFCCSASPSQNPRTMEARWQQVWPWPRISRRIPRRGGGGVIAVPAQIHSFGLITMLV